MGVVTRIVDFGAFVEIFPGTDGLLHISEIADRRVKDVRDELKEGQQILVKCIGAKATRSSFPARPSCAMKIARPKPPAKARASEYLYLGFVFCRGSDAQTQRSKYQAPNQ